MPAQSTSAAVYISAALLQGTAAGSGPTGSGYNPTGTGAGYGATNAGVGQHAQGNPPFSDPNTGYNNPNAGYSNDMQSGHHTQPKIGHADGGTHGSTPVSIHSGEFGSVPVCVLPSHVMHRHATSAQ